MDLWKTLKIRIEPKGFFKCYLIRSILFVSSGAGFEIRVNRLDFLKKIRAHSVILTTDEFHGVHGECESGFC